MYACIRIAVLLHVEAEGVLTNVDSGVPMVFHVVCTYVRVCM